MFKGRDRLKTIINRRKVLRLQNMKPSYAIDCKLNRCNKKSPKYSLTTTNIEGVASIIYFFETIKNCSKIFSKTQKF